MCLYSKLIKNPKYKANNKNGGEIPPMADTRISYVPIACGNCIECRKKKAREWQVRLLEDIKTNKNGKFVTLTFSNESIKEISEMPPNKQWKGIQGLTGYDANNAIAIHAVRLFNERWRKKYKKAIRHWLITELGHEGTQNIHLHGIIWTNESMDEVERIWKYGIIWKGKKVGMKGNEPILQNYVNDTTVGYMTKYVNKIDEVHKEYKAVILSSPGIGRNYTNTHDSKKNEFRGEQTKETYRTKTGHQISMPTYWRNKIYTEEEREKLWLMKLDKQVRWVMGEKVDISQGEENYYKLLRWYQEKNKQLGYKGSEKDWSRAKYEEERAEMMRQTRIRNANGYRPPARS